MEELPFIHLNEEDFRLAIFEQLNGPIRYDPDSRPSDRVRKKMKNYAEISGNIMRKKVPIMRKRQQIMRKFPTKRSRLRSSFLKKRSRLRRSLLTKQSRLRRSFQRKVR